MGAARFVGRVGGLAVALGVGAAVFYAGGEASADTAGPAAGSSDTAGASSAAGPRSTAASRRSASGNAIPKSSSRQRGAATRGAAVVAAGAESSVPSVAGAARRLSLSTATTKAAAAQVTSSATASATSGSLTVDPTVEFVDGIIQGNLNAVSSRALTLTYTILGDSCGSNCGLGDIGGKISVGTVPVSPPTVPSTTDPQSFTILPYANWLDGGTKGTQTFGVRVSEVTQLDQFLIGIPLVGTLAAPIINLLQTLPLIGDLLAPIIGSSIVAAIAPNVNTLAPGSTPVAYTYAVTSFDGVKISTNYFPAAGIADGDTAPTAINMPGLGSAGSSNPYSTYGIGGETLGVAPLREEGYNVVTVTPRGEFNSGGILQLDNPFYEGRDVSSVVDWIATNPLSELNGTGDPAVGMVGGSYGGGIQLTVAGTDPRIDAIVPDIAWNSLNSSLYPDNIFKTAYASLLYLSLFTTGARVNSLIPRAILTGDLLGWITETAQAVLASSGPTSLLNQTIAPTLLTQGIVDVLFPLQQSLDNAQTILGNGFGVPVKLIWFCGGHGVCLDTISTAQPFVLLASGLDWLNQYVAGTGSLADAIPNFQWFDQLGDRYSSELLPYESGFNDLADIDGISDGGFLPIVPILGGSNGTGGIYGLGGGAVASNAINVPITVGAGTQVVGAPTLTFDYQGLGTSRAVFAQVVNNSTGQVLGNIVTPVPVTLDGQQRTVTMDLSNIVYTYGGDTTPGSLTVQITSSATAFENLTSFGLMTISNVSVTMPNRTTPLVP
ncbi:MAG: CocE/NonD family hydrolase [Mycobacterium sp.]